MSQPVPPTTNGEGKGGGGGEIHEDGLTEAPKEGKGSADAVDQGGTPATRLVMIESIEVLPSIAVPISDTGSGTAEEDGDGQA
jgi:hypothetical protein